MSGSHPLRITLLLSTLLATGHCDMGTGQSTSEESGGAADRLSIAVLGDSDSHAYHDDLNLPPPHRGGERYRAVTLQWTELLERLRPDQLDFGARGTWGTRRRYAILSRLFGRPARYPVKQDFEYNMALSGATCADLTRGENRQVPALIAIIERDRSRWQRGLVVVRIGINSLARPEQLERYAVAGLTPAVEHDVAACADEIEAAVRALRGVLPTVPVALVGIAEDTNGPPLMERWHTREAIDNIKRVLDRFDHRLGDLAAADPNIVFVDDRGWWERYWGGRDGDGVPQPTVVNLGGTTEITNASGDHPSNAVTADGHAGTVANGLWARHLIHTVNDAFGLGVSPPLDAEIADLVDPAGELGIAPAARSVAGPPEISLAADSLVISEAELPFTLPAVGARDANGTDVSSTIVAFAVDQRGRRLWLYGDGATLQLRIRRHPAGDYEVHVVARDRSGRSSAARLRVSID